MEGKRGSDRRPALAFLSSLLPPNEDRGNEGRRGGENFFPKKERMIARRSKGEKDSFFAPERDMSGSRRRGEGEKERERES